MTDFSHPERPPRTLWQHALSNDWKSFQDSLRHLLASLALNASSRNPQPDAESESPLSSLAKAEHRFASLVTEACSTAIISHAISLRSQLHLGQDEDLKGAVDKLVGLLNDEIVAALQASHSALVAGAAIFQLSAKELADIEYLYTSGACFEPVESGADTHPTDKREYFPANIINLVLALTTVVGV